MTEPDVTLTDYAIALECLILCMLITRWRQPAPRLQRWWIVLFASVGAGALFGGTVHGFFLDESTTGYRMLWPATLLALGVTSLAMWFIGSLALLREPAGAWVRRAAAVLLLAYTYVVVFVDSRFLVAIFAYLPATVFLLVVLSIAYTRHHTPGLGNGIVGLLLTFVAAAVQQLGIGIHPVYFNHNALYHVIQGVALAMLYVGARAITTTTTPRT